MLRRGRRARAATSCSPAARRPSAPTSSRPRAGADWSGATVWFGDERCVPPDDERSNFTHGRTARCSSRLRRRRRRVHAHGGRARAAGAARRPTRRSCARELGDEPRLGPAPARARPRRAHRVAVPRQAGGGGAPIGSSSACPRPGWSRGCRGSRSRCRRSTRPSASSSSSPARASATPCGARSSTRTPRARRPGCVRRASCSCCSTRAARAVSDHFVGIDVGGTKIAVGSLSAGELTESHLAARPSSRIAGQARRAARVGDRRRAHRGHARGRDRRAVADRVRDGPDRLQREHPAPGRAAARAALRAHRAAGLRRQRRELRGARRGLRRQRPADVPAPGDVHDRHRRRRRARAQRQALPRRGRHGGRVRAHDHRARPRRRRRADRGASSRSTARSRRSPPAARSTRSRSTPPATTRTRSSASGSRATAG